MLRSKVVRQIRPVIATYTIVILELDPGIHSNVLSAHSVLAIWSDEMDPCDTCSRGAQE